MISRGAWYCLDLDKLFAIDVKGGEKATKGFYKTIKGRVLPSMPKGDIVGNVVIDGNGSGKYQQKDQQKEQRSREEARQIRN